jgi:hypothetical protein
MTSTRTLILSLLAALLLTASANAQEADILQPGSDEPVYTIFSVKLSGGYGVGRARQMYGLAGNEQVYWSPAQGAKLDIGLVIPLLPIDVVNLEGEEFGPEHYPVVGLELEVASGYHMSTGGTTNDELSGGNIMTTKRFYSAIPVTIGFNARATLGPGFPSIFAGVGGGVNIKAEYQDNISFSANPTTYTRKYDPPIPMVIYGVLGFEIPLLYSAEEGNSIVDLFAQARLEESSLRVYDYKVEGSDGSQAVVRPGQDPYMLYLKDDDLRTASSVSFSLGVKINIF